MNLFKQRQGKNFNYKSRYQNNDNKTPQSLESEWENLKGSNKRKGSKFTSLPFLIILLVVALILWYILNTY